MSKRRRIVKRATPAPDPVFVPSTGEYVGNDGPWSTLQLSIGTPPRMYKLLASTSSPETWVIGTEGCTDSDNQDCPGDRGQIFNSSKSTTWQDWTNRTKYTLDDNRQLPMGGVGYYGIDNITISSQRNEPRDIMVPDHTIARIATKDYFLGMFGLNIRSLAPEKQVSGRTSNLVDMKKRGIIPSLSYGFTAGAKYRRQGPASRPAHTQLVLGGYDQKAYVPNDVDFKMSPPESGRGELSVSVKSIQYGTNSTSRIPLNTTPFIAAVDSSVSHYWLPPEICDTFARAFDLTYNETVGLYLVNDTQHNSLIAMNPTISFTLADEADPNKEITISLPYPAFELRVTSDWPQGPNWSRYFPIRPAINSQQYTLGRAFLQESYLISNYENQNFSLSQRSFSAEKPVIVPIRDRSRPVQDEGSNAATYGLIAGGCALAGLLILFLVYRCARKREKDTESASDSTEGKAELDSTANRTIFELGKEAEVIELDSKARVEAANPDIKCAYDHQQEITAAQGPFELPADTMFAPSSSSPHHLQSRSNPQTPTNDDEEEQISPVDSSPASNFTGHSWNHTISPITPCDSTQRMMRREPSVPSLPAIQEKGKSTEKS